MKIRREEVEHVALLARLRLTEEEKDMFARQLSQILDHIAQLNRYETVKVEPTTTVTGQVNVFRDDTVCPSLLVEQALANAPERVGDGFHVPKIIDERSMPA
ncbi:MAG: Asp-tRNA(Asn)/Glu-tRNA(Gln) amidotransferase subunit GatC [Nitrospira sp.]|nr:Asp-tRNA(Asn)/Glu-tRNA(Gln) amidotransferase subunit GatC [Nitrospira sp.]